MRRIDILITEARRESDNVDFSDETGLQDSEFLRWANSAQTRIASLIQLRFPNVFQKVKTFSATAGTEEYSLPNDVFYGARLQVLEYSRTGLDTDYYPLKTGYLHERLSGLPSVPAFYIRRSNQILIQPRPSEAGTFRLTYQKKFSRLDTRRATVLSVTLDTATRKITALTFDPSVDLDSTNMADEQYITIVDAFGTIQMLAIPITSIDSTTGVATIPASFTYVAGETIAAGNYALLGGMSTTHSELPDEGERYLTEFMIWKARKRDSSVDSQEVNQELKEIEDDIVSTYAEASADIDYVPVIDGQYGVFERY